MINLSKNIAIIPSRLGSKRIRQKNIRKFCSKPILYWTLKNLKQSKLFSRIIITSESSKVLRVANNLGFKEFLKRKKKLSKDYISTDEVIVDAIKTLEKKYDFENVCCIYPCSPFLEKSDLIKAYKLIQKDKNGFAFGVSNYEHPIQRSLGYNKRSRKLSINNKNLFFKRTQDLKDMYHDVGQFYFAHKNTWLKKINKTRYGVKIPSWRSIDIDNNDDWKKAELIFKSLRKNG